MIRKASKHCRTLSQIPATFVASAAEELPPCSAEAAPRILVVDTPLWGTFNVTFRPARHAGPVGLEPRWVWIAVAAERTG
jgi:hypothetical protein